MEIAAQRKIWLILILLTFSYFRIASQTLSVQEETTASVVDCLSEVLPQSNVLTVYICEANLSFCPKPVVATVASALFVNNEAMDIVLGRRDFCVMAAESSARMRALMTKFKGFHKANVILAFPYAVIPQLGELKLIFEEAWNAGVVDISVVLESSLSCEVFSYVPFRGDGVCHDTTPILLNSWEVSTERAQDVSKTYFPANKISNLQTCELSITCTLRSLFNLYEPVAEYAA